MRFLSSTDELVLRVNDGGAQLATDKQLTFTNAAAHLAYMYLTNGGNFTIRGGAAGTRIMDTAGSNELVTVSNAGLVTIKKALTLTRVATVPGTGTVGANATQGNQFVFGPLAQTVTTANLTNGADRGHPGRRRGRHGRASQGSVQERQRPGRRR